MYFKNAIQQYGINQATILFTVLYFLTERAGIPDHEVQAYAPLVQTFINQHPELLPSSGGGATWGSITGSITDQTDLQTQLSALSALSHKVIANNADTDLFSFPLASGEITSVEFRADVLAKKGSDWAILGFEINFCAYNDGGTLVTTIVDTPFLETKKKLASAVDLAPFNSSLSNGTTPTLTLNTGVVTASINPGNVGTSPDSIAVDITVNTTTVKEITFL